MGSIQPKTRFFGAVTPLCTALHPHCTRTAPALHPPRAHNTEIEMRQGEHWVCVSAPIPPLSLSLSLCHATQVSIAHNISLEPATALTLSPRVQSRCMEWLY